VIQTTLLALLFAQGSPQRMTYGVEIAFRSGHADRGFIINDRPVVQLVMWADQAMLIESRRLSVVSEASAT